MTKQIYWKCVDCNSMINDENMLEEDEFHEIELENGDTLPFLQAEFCWGCMNYHPEVVLAYD